MLLGGLCLTFWFPFVFFPWAYALQCGSILAGESVARVIQAVEKFNPGDPEWETVVVAGIRALVTNTMPDLSNTFGNSVGLMVLSLWTFALGLFVMYLESGNAVSIAFGFVIAFLPFGFANTVSTTSTSCDTLREGLNVKRGSDLSTHLQLAALETYMKELNRGQGLG